MSHVSDRRIVRISILLGPDSIVLISDSTRNLLMPDHVIATNIY